MIFVTGGTGFLGAHLLTELVKQDKPVVALKRRQSKTQHTERLFAYKFKEPGNELFQKIKWVEGDILDRWSLEENMTGIKEVYHCAAEVNLRDKNPDSIIITAEQGTENMVNAALKAGVEKFCHVSSIAALENPMKPGMRAEITEENFDDFSFDKSIRSKNKNSPYSIGKHLAEKQVWRASAEGLKVTVVSPCIILGPWSETHKGSMSLFAFVDRLSRFYTAGAMGYTDVSDVVSIMLTLMEKGPYNERFIVNSESLNFRDFFTAIAKEINKPLPAYYLNYFNLKLFQFFNNLASSYKISNTMVEHATVQRFFSNSKVRKALGYTFTPLAETIAETAKFYLSQRDA